jgi:metal-sulfur cluster biosynthetic enzyme
MRIKNDEGIMGKTMEALSEKEIHQVIARIKHAAIDCSLVDLGIVKDVTIKGDIVTVTLAFPFANIPIKDYLIMSVKTPLEKLGVKVKVETTVMDEKESKRFLEMESKYWKGNQSI